MLAAEAISAALGVNGLASRHYLGKASFDLTTVREELLGSRVAGVLADATVPDQPILECNQAFIDLTGYPRDEIVGRNCRFLSRGHADAATRAKFRRVIDGGEPAIIEVLNFRKDGSSFVNGVTVAAITDSEGQTIAFLGSQVDLGPGSVKADNVPAMQASGSLRELTPRQREALIYMASGLPIKQVANELMLSERTVKLHRMKAMQALGVTNRIDAVRLAIEAGL